MPQLPAPAEERGRPVALDLYSGAGGLSLGMEQAGFDVVGAVEVDPIHADVHRYNFSDTPVLCRDISAVSADELRSLAQVGWQKAGREGTIPLIDALVGGPPCQGFSVGGVRHPSDERNDQLLRFVDLVVELQPKVFCLENVAGLLEDRFEPIRKEVVRRLTVDGGYLISGFDHPVNSADYGTPQHRRRVVVLGGREQTPTLETGTRNRTSVSEALSGLPDLVKYRRLLKYDDVQLGEHDFLTLLSVSGTYARRAVGLERDPLDKSYTRIWDNSSITNSLRTVHAARTVQRFVRTAPGEVEKVSRLFRLAPEGLSRTLRAGTGTDRGSHTSPRPIHPVKPRVITVREAARLHGYPDWFRFHATNWHGHREVGNSVPPPLASAAGRALIRVLGVEVAAPPTPKKLGDAALLQSKPRESRRLTAP